MTINLTALQKQRYDTAANWTGANPTLLAGEIGIESDTLRWKVGNGSTAWTSLAYIPGLTYGTARQLLQTNSGATGAEWTSNVDIPGTLDVTGTSTLDGMVLIGTTTSIGGGKFQVSSDTATTLQNFSFNSSANSNTASLQFVRARGTKASPSIVLNDDYIGEIRFIGYGTTYNTGASIRAIVDGDPATSGDSSDMPTKLVFLTSPNGSATPDTRMTIDSAGLVTIPGDLTVNGTTTTINSTTLVVQDKNIEMGVVATPTDVTADGGGITLKGTTDKTINWIDATDAWTFSEHVNIASAKEYRIAGTKVLDATSLGSAVVSSSLTSVGTIGTGVWQGTAIADTYLGTISTALKVSNSATTATDANTASAIVARDASGNFTAGTITASLTGAASSNVLKAGDTMTGALVVPLGAVGTPSLTFAGDTSTGIYSPGAYQVAVATNGTGRLFVDATGNVGVGTTNAVAPNSGGSLTANGTLAVRGYLADHQTSAGVFQYNDSVLTLRAYGATAGTGIIAFNTGGGGNTTDTERLRITSAGLVGIGSTVPQGKLESAAGDSTSYSIVANNNYSTGDQNYISLNASTTQIGSINRVANDIAIKSNYDGIVFWTGTGGTATQKAKIDSSGRLLVGTSSAMGAFYNDPSAAQHLFQLETTGYYASSFVSHGGTAPTGGCYLTVGRSRGTAAGSKTLVASGDTLGVLSFQGADGSDFVEAANIGAFVDGTPGADDMPGRLVFSSTADGAASPTERMRITSAGDVLIGQTSSIYGEALGVSKSSGTAPVLSIFNNSTTGNVAAIDTSLNATGNSTSSYHLRATTQTVSTWYLYGNGTLSFTSDIRKKKNIETTRDGYLEDLRQLRVVKYNWCNHEDGTPKELGLIAQEVEQVFPGLVQEGDQLEGDDFNCKVLKGSVLPFMLLKALQEAAEKIEALEAEVAALKAQ